MEGLPSKPGFQRCPAAIMRQRAASWAFVLLFTIPLMAGCGLRQWYGNGFKVGPNYCPPPAVTGSHWIDADDPRVKSLDGCEPAWWTVFRDPTLDTLVASAVQENLTLKTACFRILEARAERGVAVGNLFPQEQQMAGQYSRNAMSATAYPFDLFALPRLYYDNWSTGFNAAWELDFWGRFRRAVEAADANLDAQCASYNNVLVLLQAEVATNYVQMRTYEVRLALARKNVELQKETLRIITLREKIGLVTELDVQQATYNLGQTESIIPVLDVGRRRAENRLAILMARPPQELGRLLRVPAAIPVPPQEAIVGIPAELLRRRPDVAQAERVAAQRSAEIGIAAAEFYPHIAITGSIGVQSEKLTQLFESRSITGMIGPGFSWNLLNYGRIKNNVLAQDARFQQAVLTYRDTVLRANEEAENAIIGFLREQDRALALTRSTTAAARSVDLASQQYEKGLITYQPLLDAERVLVQQQDALAESRGLIAANLVAVYRALGGGWRASLPPPALPAAPSTELLPPPPPAPAAGK
jgi:NodT family efflux transporter outer membrane factor (OMF) lipoprotein